MYFNDYMSLVEHKSVINRLSAALNDHNGKPYPDIGFCHGALVGDIRAVLEALERSRTKVNDWTDFSN